MKALSKSFFNQDTVKVAKELIGAFLVRKIGDKVERHVIIETEAYDGPEDLACHAARGKKTKRTEVLFGESGTIYIYFTYGMHWLLNIVTGPKNYPAGVLIRGVENINGPARITKKLMLDGKFHGKKLSKETGLWIEKSNEIIKQKIISTPRIGVDYAGPVWSKKKYRFTIKENKKTRPRRTDLSQT